MSESGPLDQEEDVPRFLLLLPPLPTTSDTEIISSIYGTTIKDVLKEVTLASDEYQSDAAIIDVALAIPHLLEGTPSKSQYDQTQQQLATAYRLFCTIAAQNDFNLEDKDGVDVRILLVAWSPDVKDTSHITLLSSPVVTLTTLAASSRQWQYAFGVEDPTGTAMVSAFMQAKQHPTSDSDRKSHSASVQSSSNKSPTPCVAVGGTFDHLHIGHKLLLTMTLFATLLSSPPSPRVAIIGITGDPLLVNKKHASHLESWSLRQRAVLRFVAALTHFSPDATRSKERNDQGPNGHEITSTFAGEGLTLRAVEIGDAFGPTITEEDIAVLVISGETRSGGKAVNDKRKEKGWKELEVLEVDVLQPSGGVVSGEDFVGKISSTEIRRKLSEKAQGTR